MAASNSDVKEKLESLEEIENSFTQLHDLNTVDVSKEKSDYEIETMKNHFSKFITLLHIELKKSIQNNDSENFANNFIKIMQAIQKHRNLMKLIKLKHRSRFRDPLGYALTSNYTDAFRELFDAINWDPHLLQVPKVLEKILATAILNNNEWFLEILVLNKKLNNIPLREVDPDAFKEATRTLTAGAISTSYPEEFAFYNGLAIFQFINNENVNELVGNSGLTPFQLALENKLYFEAITLLKKFPVNVYVVNSNGEDAFDFFLKKVGKNFLMNQKHGILELIKVREIELKTQSEEIRRTGIWKQTGHLMVAIDNLKHSNICMMQTLNAFVHNSSLPEKSKMAEIESAVHSIRWACRAEEVNEVNLIVIYNMLRVKAKTPDNTLFEEIVEKQLKREISEKEALKFEESLAIKEGRISKIAQAQFNIRCHMMEIYKYFQQLRGYQSENILVQLEMSDKDNKEKKEISENEKTRINEDIGTKLSPGQSLITLREDSKVFHISMLLPNKQIIHLEGNITQHGFMVTLPDQDKTIVREDTPQVLFKIIHEKITTLAKKETMKMHI